MLRICYILFPIILPFKAWGENKSSLVQIFCDELVSANQMGEELDLFWPRLILRFESRNGVPHPTNPAWLTRCIEQWSDEFDRAEFILGGHEYLSVPQQAYAKGSADVEEVQPIVETSIYSGVISTTKISSSLFAPEDHALKQIRFTALWKDFLTQLRFKLASNSFERYRLGMGQEIAHHE